jgi:hypothetical protein
MLKIDVGEVCLFAASTFCFFQVCFIEKKIMSAKMIVQDIVSRIVQVSRISGKAICVLSLLGSVQEAKLLHASRVILNHKV